MKEPKIEKIKMFVIDILHSTVIYYVKQIFPLAYWTKYKTDGKSYVAMWRQWFGLTFEYMAFEVKK